jgi:hypothetical protein
LGKRPSQGRRVDLESEFNNAPVKRPLEKSEQQDKNKEKKAKKEKKSGNQICNETTNVIEVGGRVVGFERNFDCMGASFQMKFTIP